MVFCTRVDASLRLKRRHGFGERLLQPVAAKNVELRGRIVPYKVAASGQCEQCETQGYLFHQRSPFS
jgi:hypothetical protein